MRQASAARTGTRRPSVDLRDTESPIKRFLRRNLIALCGLGIIAIAAGLAAALATWSVSDPSLNHATGAPVHNALGTPGAIISDVLMQTIGLATAVFLVPIVLWGWRLVTGKALRIRRRRILFWFVGTVLAAGALASLPIPESWPLPTGLGGFLGDKIHFLPALITSNMTEGAAMIVGAIGLGLPAAFFLIASAGWFSTAERDAAPVDEAPAVPRGHGRQIVTMDDDEEDEASESRLGMLASAAIGQVSHTLLLGGALLRRVFGVSPKRAAEEPEWIEEDEEDAVAGYEPEDTRQAGVLKRFRRSLADKLSPDDDDGLDAFYERGKTQRQAPENDPGDDLPDEDPEPGYQDDPFDFDDDEDPDIRFEPGDLLSDRGEVARPADLKPIGIASPDPEDQPVPAAPTGRVVPPAPRPRPGQRARADAQPNFLKAPEDYELPPLQLLAEPRTGGKIPGLSADALEQNARILEGVLEDFGVRGEIIEVRPGPVVTLYELEPAPGIKSSRVIGLADDIARSMSAISARVAVIPGKNAIGIELPNARRETVYLRELLAAQDFEKSKAKLAMALGKTINGESVVADLARMPHLLVAGTTGSGKSVSINTMILSLLYRLTPDQCKMIMIDPKMLELSIYDGIPHLLTPVVTDPKKAVVALKWTVREMEERYKKMSKMGVRNIDGYNTRIKQALEKGESFSRTVQTGFDRDTGEPIYEEEELPLEAMSYIVVIVDEMADLMMVAGKDIEGAIQRLAQMARAAGIHLIMATQRPSVDVITGTIKANFPTRISFQVTSKIDSRTILGEMGAEQLLGMGDMLFMAGGARTQRVHGPFVSDDEVEDIVKHLKVQGTPQYLEAVTEEDDDADSPYDGGSSGGGGDEGNDLYDKAVAIVLRDKKASTSYVQRRLSIGYNRAASLIERMEQEGLISPANHAGKREILVKNGVEEDI
ncbi:DNA translocase FtsK [Roseibium sp. RKSG952]|uniref:DNA translocase FtsK n=1 Tax=Roseibium sp. RKSG952 TaxID=2529384 RepID=UPI0012BD33CA|nr:DNA translocase FtsK [Roseibium sp. RKSG952]MTH97162.1 DNA translocase FtsK [Roseibium sp. RKSG952]